ncbi:MAG: hypothetical protein EZS28_044800, partial [Streblomastix strix]
KHNNRVIQAINALTRKLEKPTTGGGKKRIRPNSTSSRERANGHAPSKVQGMDNLRDAEEDEWRDSGDGAKAAEEEASDYALGAGSDSDEFQFHTKKKKPNNASPNAKPKRQYHKRTKGQNKSQSANRRSGASAYSTGYNSYAQNQRASLGMPTTQMQRVIEQQPLLTQRAPSLSDPQSIARTSFPQDNIQSQQPEDVMETYNSNNNIIKQYETFNDEDEFKNNDNIQQINTLKRNSKTKSKINRKIGNTKQKKNPNKIRSNTIDDIGIDVLSNEFQLISHRKQPPIKQSQDDPPPMLADP